MDLEDIKVPERDECLYVKSSASNLIHCNAPNCPITIEGIATSERQSYNYMLDELANYLEDKLDEQQVSALLDKINEMKDKN